MSDNVLTTTCVDMKKQNGGHNVNKMAAPTVMITKWPTLQQNGGQHVINKMASSPTAMITKWPIILWRLIVTSRVSWRLITSCYLRHFLLWRCHGTLPWDVAIGRCHGTLPWGVAMGRCLGRCHGTLPSYVCDVTLHLIMTSCPTSGDMGSPSAKNHKLLHTLIRLIMRSQLHNIYFVVCLLHWAL